jgi:hypothetical protein
MLGTIIGGRSMLKKPFLGAAICAAAVLGMSSPALAGEVTGNGKTTPINMRANSSCAFSGLQDHDPAQGGTGIVVPGEVQNWGHTKGAPVVVAAPRGASSVTLDFGDGPFDEGCNAHMYPSKGSEPTP